MVKEGIAATTVGVDKNGVPHTGEGRVYKFVDKVEDKAHKYPANLHNDGKNIEVSSEIDKETSVSLDKD